MDRFLDLDKLLHHGLIDLKPSGRIQEYQVTAFLFCVLHCRFCDIHRRIVLSHGEYGNTHLFTVDLQLLNGCRAVDIAGRQQGIPSFGLEFSRQLCGGGRLTGALETDHHDHRDLILGL